MYVLLYNPLHGFQWVKAPEIFYWNYQIQITFLTISKNIISVSKLLFLVSLIPVAFYVACL